ncbi:hypothetical protein L1987_57848 [Smallanthus sonchifolius]|uniref:Uncharacterized protein n=1 Tax=Smallanthus sonchifolius TaxID=185202 RepID=A0ACB9DDW1_9ASTR|nr:hypothetical protein L1987_57848 [Smallanthus sonchifolius]
MELQQEIVRCKSHMIEMVKRIRVFEEDPSAISTLSCGLCVICAPHLKGTHSYWFTDIWVFSMANPESSVSSNHMASLVVSSS